MKFEIYYEPSNGITYIRGKSDRVRLYSLTRQEMNALIALALTPEKQTNIGASTYVYAAVLGITKMGSSIIDKKQARGFYRALMKTKFCDHKL